jgi:nicotinamide-nucleotide amidase
MVRLRITGTGDDREWVVNEVEKQVKELNSLIPDLIFGYDNDTLESVTGDMLRSLDKTLSTAESCTGGYIAHLLTTVAGSSDYYKGSVIAYDNSIKENILDVDTGLLREHGAVSEPVVRQMAEGVRNKFRTDYALATSGIAGPGGGTIDKPVGLVYIALATPMETEVKKFTFGEHRGRNIRKSALAALNMLRAGLAAK